MLAFKIAMFIAGVPLGIWLGFKVAGICISWLRFWLRGLKPPKGD